MVDAPVLFFAPFVSSVMRIEPAWIDAHGHLNMAYYHVLIDRSLDELFEQIGFDPDYRATRQCSTFTVENHITYRRELKITDLVRVTAQLIDCDEKRIHLYMEMRNATDGWLSACAEGLFVHVDMRTMKVTPFPDDIASNLMVMRAAHARLPRPVDLGRVIGLRRQSVRLN